MSKTLPGRTRYDYVIDKPAPSGGKGASKLGTILIGAGAYPRRIIEFMAKDDFDGALGSHYRDFSSGPGVVDIAA